MKVDKTLIASVALHVLVIGWGLVSFSARSLEAPPLESMPVDIISADQLSKITAGIKTGEKDKPKPLVEKVADAKPAEDAVGKITEKKEIVTASAPEPPPKPVEKPVEKKPEPPKPVAESKPKDEPKPIEKKPDPPKIDPIAEALKSEDSKKPVPKPRSQGGSAAAAEAEAGTHLRSIEDRGPARQARSDPPVDHRCCAELLGVARDHARHRSDLVAVRT